MAPEGRGDGSGVCDKCGIARERHVFKDAGHRFSEQKAGFEWPEGWKRQMLGYRYGLNVANGTSKLDFSVVVLHLIQPKLTAWRAHFSLEEQQANWDWLKTRRDTLLQMYETNDPQPFTHNESWECSNCRYSLVCGLRASIDHYERNSQREVLEQGSL
jgi:hypothetical protein